MLGRRNNRELQIGHDWTTAAAGMCLAIAAGAIAAGSPTAVRAAEAGTADETTGPLTEIVVTATRHEEGLSKVPISVTALTQ